MPVLITQIVQSGENQENLDSWWQQNVVQYLTNPSSWQYILGFFALIVFFSFFYVSVQYSPDDQAENMKKYGGFIPGYRPGRPTAQYLGYVMTRLLVVGSTYLGLIAVLPNLALDMGLGGGSGSMAGMFGGTALLILVSVSLTTVKQIESQMMQRNYEGFLK